MKIRRRKTDERKRDKTGKEEWMKKWVDKDSLVNIYGRKI